MASADPIQEVKKIALILGAILIVGLGIIISLLVPQISASRRQAEEGFALTNVKKVATALLAYAEEHGTLPAEEAYADGSFAPGLAVTDFLVRPNDSETLALNLDLARKPLPEGAPPVIMVFPSSADWPLRAMSPQQILGERPCFAWSSGKAECLPRSEIAELTDRERSANSQ